MATGYRRQFIYVQTLWMLAAAVLLVFFEALSYELFFVLALAGFFVILSLTSPTGITPGWRVRLRWLAALGFVVFCYLVVRQILAVLPSGLVLG